MLLANRYLLLEEIGRGGHATVHRAHDQRLGRDVAVKVLRREASSANIVARFEREIRLTATLEHPHILHVQDTGVHEGQLFLVTELATGGSLADRLVRESPLPMTDALQIVRDVGLALAHAHAHGVVHRDVKPANILLRDGTALLADFGVAFAEPEALQQRLTSAGLAVGTAQYMSPEQLCADPTVDGRSDQYALALVLYELLAGVPAQTARTLEGLRLQRMAAPPLGVRTHRPSVPEPIEQALQTALAPVPADRFREMGAFLAAIGITASGEFRYGSTAERANPTSALPLPVPPGTERVPSASERSINASAPLRSAGVAFSRSGTRGRAFALLSLGALGLATLAWAIGSESSASASDRLEASSTVRLALVDVREPSTGAASATARVVRALAAELGAWRDVTLVPAGARDADVWRIEPAVRQLGDSASVVLEVQRGRTATTRVVAMSRLATDEDEQVLAATLARRLLAGVAPDDAPGLEALPVRSLTALRSYVAGHRHVQAGALDSAEAAFRETLAEARLFSAAAYWTAQVAAWRRPRNRESWAPEAETAIGAAGVDSLLVHGLRALGQADYPRACASYRAAVTSDPGSFVGWYGLGDCQRLDSVVVRRGEALVFRGSMWSALQAYQRAISVSPAPGLMAALYPAVARSTYADGGRARMGWSEGENATEYRALLALSGDTLAFQVELLSALGRGAGGSVPRTYTMALRRTRAAAVDLGRAWIERHPSSAEAWLGHVKNLELAGTLGRGGARLVSLDSAMAQTERLAVSSPPLLAELSVARVRIALRRGHVDSAFTVARQTLAGSDATEAMQARLGSLAAFVGDATRLLAAPVPPVEGLPSPVQEAIAALHRHALLEQCAAVDAARREVERLLTSTVAAEQRDAARAGWLRQVYRDALPCLGAQSAMALSDDVRFDAAVRQLYADRHAAALRELDAMQEARSGVSAGSVSWDFQFLEAWVRAEAGDTLGAVRQLDAAFSDLATMSGFTLDYESQAAGVRRAVRLYCTLAGGVTPNAGTFSGNVAGARALSTLCMTQGETP